MKIISYQQEQLVMDFLRQPLIVLHLHYIDITRYNACLNNSFIRYELIARIN